MLNNFNLGSCPFLCCLPNQSAMANQAACFAWTFNVAPQKRDVENGLTDDALAQIL
jgi:hypothetical protein